VFYFEGLEGWEDRGGLEMSLLVERRGGGGGGGGGGGVAWMSGDFFEEV
jgi:hypothetical protein